MPPRVSVVVPVYNKARFLPAALDSIVAAVGSSGDAELIVVDHGSTDGSRELLESRYRRNARIADHRGGTIAAVRNQGARLATGSVLSFIDADCVIPPDYLGRLVEVLAVSGAGATGAEVVPPPSPSWVEDVWYRLHQRRADGEQEWIGSANLAVLREAFDAVGGFDERLVTGEDTALCQRLRDRGYRIFESKQLTAVHLDNAKTLGDFYRKELWRGLGMFGTVRAGAIDKPTVMTVVHVVLCAAAVLALAAAPWALPARLGAAAGLVLAVPVATLVYRGLGGGSLATPAPRPAALRGVLRRPGGGARAHHGARSSLIAIPPSRRCTCDVTCSADAIGLSQMRPFGDANRTWTYRGRMVLYVITPAEWKRIERAHVTSLTSPPPGAAALPAEPPSDGARGNGGRAELQSRHLPERHDRVSPGPNRSSHADHRRRRRLDRRHRGAMP